MEEKLDVPPEADQIYTVNVADIVPQCFVKTRFFAGCGLDWGPVYKCTVPYQQHQVRLAAHSVWAVHFANFRNFPHAYRVFLG